MKIKVELEVTNILHMLGMPSHIKGFEYLRKAILMVYDDSSYLRAVTKRLYPNISVIYNSSSPRVERAIRHAIEISWLRADVDYINEVFGSSIDAERAKPTNSEYIMIVADKVRMDMKKNSK